MWRGQEPDLKSYSSLVAGPGQESEAPISLFLIFPQHHTALYPRQPKASSTNMTVMPQANCGMFTDSFRSINIKSIPSSYPLVFFFPLSIIVSSSWFDIIKSIPGSLEELPRNEGPPSGMKGLPPRPHSSSIHILLKEPESPISPGGKNPGSALDSHSGPSRRLNLKLLSQSKKLRCSNTTIQ